MQRRDALRAIEVAVRQVEDAAQPLGPAGLQRGEGGQFRHVARLSPGPPGGLRRALQFRIVAADHGFERDLGQLRRIARDLLDRRGGEDPLGEFPFGATVARRHACDRKSRRLAWK